MQKFVLLTHRLIYKSLGMYGKYYYTNFFIFKTKVSRIFIFLNHIAIESDCSLFKTKNELIIKTFKKFL